MIKKKIFRKRTEIHQHVYHKQNKKTILEKKKKKCLFR